MRVVFLDYDGVVNNIVWDAEGKRADYGSASSKKVNDFQAVQWVSEFCEKFGYDIVVSSTWRLWEWYKEALINGGLRDGINIVGCTPVLYKHSRGDERYSRSADLRRGHWGAQRGRGFQHSDLRYNG